MGERRLEYMPLAALEANPANPKAHDVEGIRSSFDRLGYIEPVTIDERTGMLVSGHGRVKSLVAAYGAGGTPPDGVTVASDGSWLVPVHRGWASKDDVEANAALVALNRWVELGGWDDRALADLLSNLSHEPTGLAGVGFGDDDLADLLARLNRQNRPALADPDEVPDLPKEPITQPGDLWLLGAYVECPNCGHHNDL